ncbi:MAG: hypothetical protein V3R73_03030, partial [Sphingomonadales bacterium]
DQWDLLLMFPAGDYPTYFSKVRVEQRAAAFALKREIDKLAAFREDMFAFGPDLETVTGLFKDYDFYHVEIFNALPGKHGELLDERRMENTYLEALGIRPNQIWVVDQGSDADSFTIGFYTSLLEYATPPKDIAPEEKNRLAIEAGFEGRSFIGTYLRELISAHHDTLAVSVR